MLLFGGIELLFPDADGELAKFLRDHQNVAESIEFAERRLSELSPRRGLLSWYGVRKGIGQTIANYPEPPKPELNTLYWPTGASRFARGFFLAAGAAKEAIVKKAHGGGANVPLTLKMGDQDNYFLETSMYLLPPRIVARPIPEQGKPDESLWILPLVDERYWWQERSTDDLEVTTSTTWASLFTTLGTKLGVTISTPTAVEAAYLQPDPIEFTRRYENVPAMLDAAALSVGKRIVRRIDGTVRAESAADALTAFQGNFDGNWRQICGGGLSAPTGATPAAAVTTFRRWRDYAILQKGKVHAETNNAPDGSVVVSGTKKQIHSTAYADFTASDSSPSNSSDLATLATAISTDYYAWLARLHDYTFAGVKPWAPTGFDDAIVWRFGCQGSAGEYQAQTRIQSLPVDFGFDLQLSQFSNRGLFEPVMLVKPDADIAIDGTGTVSVWTGRAGAKTDSTINVTAHAEFGATGGVFAVMRWIEDDWEIEVGAGTDIIRFELAYELRLPNDTDATDTPNHVMGYRLALVGGSWTYTLDADDNVEIYDPYPRTSTTGGNWNGLAGYRGMAVRRPVNYTASGENSKYTLRMFDWGDDDGTLTLEINGSPIGAVTWTAGDFATFEADLAAAIQAEVGPGNFTLTVLEDYPDAVVIEIEFNGSLAATATTLDVDSFTHDGSGILPTASGVVGTADDIDRDAYDIIWMERIAQWIDTTSTERMGKTAPYKMHVNVTHFDDQGRNPELSTGVGVVLYDPTPVSGDEEFPDVHSGARGRAVYNNRYRRYEIARSQRACMFALATSDGDQCPTEEFSVASFTALPTSGEYVGGFGTDDWLNFTGTLPDIVSSVIPCLSGDGVLLMRNRTGFAWRVVQGTPHQVDTLVSVDLGGGSLTYTPFTIYAYICTTDTLTPVEVEETTEC